MMAMSWTAKFIARWPAVVSKSAPVNWVVWVSRMAGAISKSTVTRYGIKALNIGRSR